MKIFAAYLICFFSVEVSYGQLHNLINNGGFEDWTSLPVAPNVVRPKHWNAIDSGKKFAYSYRRTVAPGKTAPYDGGFQFPRSGEAMIISTIYCDPGTCSPSPSRGYPRNKLKQLLTANKRYCAQFYVNNYNVNPIAIAEFGMFLGDTALDTIKACASPLPFLIPQVENKNGAIIDTLGWTLISGTFTASGNERYALLGNFRTNANTTTVTLVTTTASPRFTDIYFDDVSLFELQEHFAGPDVAITPGDSVYIGGERDPVLDQYCTWFVLPQMIHIDSMSGMWVKPSFATRYVMRLSACSGIYYDTVTVSPKLASISDDTIISANWSVKPIPAAESIQVQAHTSGSFTLHNQLGVEIFRAEIHRADSEKTISISDLPSGIYLGRFDSSQQRSWKRIVVVH